MWDLTKLKTEKRGQICKTCRDYGAAGMVDKFEGLYNIRHMRYRKRTDDDVDGRNMD